MQGAGWRSPPKGLAAKQRLLLPARVALALQADGWWVRSEIVWAKGVSFCPTYAGSCMPSSVRDRPTDSHEMVYLLTKQARYFYDADAVRERGTLPAGQRHAKGSEERRSHATGAGPVNARPPEYAVSTGTRNIRTVWTVNPQAYREAHFATFPEKLVTPCIKAGTSEKGACVECGAPWWRVVDLHGGSTENRNTPSKIGKPRDTRPRGADLSGVKFHQRTTTGWEPTCNCDTTETRPCLVLDPFNGSGTTGAVAVRLGRRYVGVELNPEYVELAHKRIGSAEESRRWVGRVGRSGRRYTLDGEVTTRRAIESALASAGVSKRDARRVIEGAEVRRVCEEFACE